MSYTWRGVKLTIDLRHRSHFAAWCCTAAEKILSVFFIVALAAHILTPHQAHAAAGVAKYLSYQGRLTDTSGNALGGAGTNYCFRFSIYEDATVGAPDTKDWPTGTPVTNTVNVINGVFNIGVGEADDLTTFDFSALDTIYLNIEVAAQSVGSCTGVTFETLTPRQRIDAVAFSRLSFDLYGGRARIGTGAGGTTPKYLLLDVKNTADTIGNSCTTSGTMWYNSSNTKTLTCDNGTIQEVGNAATLVGLKETSSGSTITSGTVQFSGSNNITVSQTLQSIKLSVPNMIYAQGVSNTGTTAGNTGTKDNATFVFAASGNVTMSQSTGAASVHTIWVSVPAQSVQTQNVHNVTISSNTAGVGAAISSGTMALAGGANITLSQNGGNTITIIGGAGGAAGSNTIGMSNLGNTVGTSGVIQSSAMQFLFAGGNNITLSQSINGASGTITISAFNQTAQTQNLHNLTLAGNSTSAGAGYIQVSSGTLTLAGGNNITLSQNGNAVTISAGAGGGGLGAIGNTASSNAFTSGSVMFSGLANITVNTSVNGASQYIQISAPTPGGGGAPTISYFNNVVGGSAVGNLATVNVSASNGTMWLFPLNQHLTFPANMTVNTMYLNLSISGSTATLSGAHSSTVRFAIYTQNGSSLSLLNSVLTSWTRAASTNNSTFYQGQRFLSIHSSQFSAQPTFAAGSIYIGALAIRTSASNAQTFAFLGQHLWSTAARSGTLGSSQANVTHMGVFPFAGVYTSATSGYSSGFPASIHYTQLNRGSANAYFMPHVIFNNLISSF